MLCYRRSQLHEAALAFKEQESDFKKEIEELEQELTEVKKREARYHLCVLQWRPGIIYVYCNGGQVSFMCTAMEARYHLCVQIGRAHV